MSQPPSAPQARWHITLRQLLVIVAACAAYLTLARQLPRVTACATFFVMASSLLMAAISLADELAWRLWFRRSSKVVARITVDGRPAVVAAFLWLTRPLTMCWSQSAFGWGRAMFNFLVALGVCVASWTVIKILGQSLVLSSESIQVEGDYFLYCLRELRDAQFIGHPVTRIWQFGAILRWLLLFGAAAPVCCWMRRATGPFDPIFAINNDWQRLLLLTPWVVVVEVAMLATFWLWQPRVIPEPSTLFVAGIFSWDQWTWWCWLDTEWLQRAALPSWILATVYLRAVIRWSRLWSLVGAVLFVPPAIVISIGWEVWFAQVILQAV